MNQDKPVTPEFRLSIPELQDRYQINRATLYKRLAALNLSPEKEGNKSFFAGQQIQKLDRLNEQIKIGIPTSTSANKILAEPEGTDKALDNMPQTIPDKALDGLAIARDSKALSPLDNVSGSLDKATDSVSETMPDRYSGLPLLELLNILITEQISKQISKTNKFDFQDLEALETIAAKNWELPTKRIAQVLGISPSTLSKNKRGLKYCGFNIIRVQQKPALWRVSKNEGNLV